MNLEGLPNEVKEDIEDQSLALLENIKEDVIIIGGWAVRALLGQRHGRYTLDIDGVTSEEMLPEIGRRLKFMGLRAIAAEWGIRFYKRYVPQVEIPPEVDVANVELRIEISGPRIEEFRTHHYFEFSLEEYVMREIGYHRKSGSVLVHIPPLEHMAAVKLGLPVDYKNNFDAAMLISVCDVKDVVRVIHDNDDWYEMVLRRLPKMIGRIRDRGRLEHMLAVNAGVDMKEHLRRLEDIQEKLMD